MDDITGRIVASLLIAGIFAALIGSIHLINKLCSFPDDGEEIRVSDKTGMDIRRSMNDMLTATARASMRDTSKGE